MGDLQMREGKIHHLKLLLAQLNNSLLLFTEREKHMLISVLGTKLDLPLDQFKLFSQLMCFWRG